jgi:hypothetical protein
MRDWEVVPHDLAEGTVAKKVGWEGARWVKSTWGRNRKEKLKNRDGLVGK